MRDRRRCVWFKFWDQVGVLRCIGGQLMWAVGFLRRRSVCRSARHLLCGRGADALAGRPAIGSLIDYSSDLTISSHIFLASPNSIMVLSRKNSSFSTPA